MGHRREEQAGGTGDAYGQRGNGPLDGKNIAVEADLLAGTGDGAQQGPLVEVAEQGANDDEQEGEDVLEERGRGRRKEHELPLRDVNVNIHSHFVK